jgi:methionine synthase II (cobalamin-independent)
MQYPTPIAPLAGTVVPEDLPRLAPSYEAALFADLDSALTTVPHDRLAIQWDVAVEVGMLEDAFGPGTSPPVEEIAAGLARAADHVPDDVPVGMHLCYGDYGHQHFKQPESLALLVRLVNAVLAATKRPVNWFSFTVPQGRSDEAYFAPLRDLQAGPETELYFALVPYYPDDQPPGTTAEQVRLIDASLAQSPSGGREWGICTECGMGRVAAHDVPKLLDLHSEILASEKR